MPRNGSYILQLTFITTENGDDASVEWFTFINIHSLEQRLQTVWQNMYVDISAGTMKTFRPSNSGDH